MLLKFSTRLLGEAMETLKDWQFLVAAVITAAVAFWHYIPAGNNHLNTEPAKSAILCAIVVFPLSLLLSLLLVLTPDQRAVLGDWWDPIGKAIVMSGNKSAECATRAIKTPWVAPSFVMCLRISLAMTLVSTNAASPRGGPADAQL